MCRNLHFVEKNVQSKRQPYVHIHILLFRESCWREPQSKRKNIFPDLHQVFQRGEKFLSQLKNGEEFEGGLEKRKGKEENKERVLKHTLVYLYEA